MEKLYKLSEFAIDTSFAGKIYGKHSRKYKRVVKAVEDAVKDP